MHKSFLQNSNKSYFLFGSNCQHAWYKPIFYWLHEMAACCYFGADLGDGLDHNFPCHLRDGTPHSSSDLLYSFPPFYSLGQNYSKSNSSSLFSSDKNIPSQNSLFPLFFLDQKLQVQLQKCKNILGQIFFVT